MMASGLAEVGEDTSKGWMEMEKSRMHVTISG